ncbi:MAG: 2-oxo acid dehydrogenase subunit E2 [Halobacteria archaeon]
MAPGPLRPRGWRKIATAVWGWPRDPQIYGRLRLEATPLQGAIEAIRVRTGVHVTLTHLVVRGLALALKEVPSMNTRLAWGRFHPRSGVDIFVIVSTGGGSDLSGVAVRGADRKPAADIARELEGRVKAAREGGGDLDRSKRFMAALPPWLLGLFLRLFTFLSNHLNLDLRSLGMPRDPFGSALVTNVGVFGVPEGFAPLAPLYRVPLILLVGDIQPKPWVVGDRVEVRSSVTITATIDHRWADGHAIAAMARAFCAYMADPLAYEGGDGKADGGDP